MLFFDFLEKSKKTPLRNVDTIRICKPTDFIGIQSLKASDEAGSDPDSFVHVIEAVMKQYNETVIVKILREPSTPLERELKAYKKLRNFQNAVKLICDFGCMDDKRRWQTKIRSPITFCHQSYHKLHFIVLEYIHNGSITDYITNASEPEIRGLFLQVILTIATLMYNHRMIHGDLHSGNILIGRTNQTHIHYTFDGRTYRVQSFGIMPLLCDFGLSSSYRKIRTGFMMENIEIVLFALSKYTRNKPHLYQKYDAFLERSYTDVHHLIDVFRRIKSS